MTNLIVEPTLKEPMSGIAGELSVHEPNITAVASMAEVLAPRGPDGSGHWESPRAALAHRRLAVVDLSEAAAQPHHDPELGLTVTLDGSIHNAAELREELSATGYRFTSRGDAELVAKAYHAWGTDAAARFEGLFAFAIIENDSHRLVLGRDRAGVKPMYWATLPDGTFRFASSLPAIVAAGGVDTSIDTLALHHFLSFHAVVPAPLTILKGVRKVSQACVMIVEPDGSRQERKYWTPDHTRHADRAGWSVEEWQDAVLDVLRTAVARRTVADVPVGCLLSGGLDSSLIVGLMAESGMSQIPTFSIGFEGAGGESGDEFTYSDIIARHYGTDHHKIMIGADRMLPGLTDAIGAMSEPMVSHDAVAFFLLSQEVSKSIKVVQSGQGADEVFAGYHWYPPLAEVADDDLDTAVEIYLKHFADRDQATMNALLQPQWQLSQDVAREWVVDRFGQPGAQTAVDRALRMDSTVMAVDDPIKRVDNMTMASGLEARMPFLDADLLNLAGTCPPELKMAHGGKGVLKEAARKVIPHEVIDRPKGYFPVPALKHLDGPYLERVRDLVTSQSAKDRGLFQPAAVDALLADPNGQLTPLRGNPLWQVALLEWWLQEHKVG